MAYHTDLSKLHFAALDILTACGRMFEHELWDNDYSHRTFIVARIKAASAEIADWLKSESAPPAVTTAPGFDGRDQSIGLTEAAINEAAE